ncbi:MAG: RNA-processing protein [DPANN group archaeon]|nr:RNA-processing protein [DPANN group archaeon]
MPKKNIDFSDSETPQSFDIFEDHILIPKIRVPILVGKGGASKKKIEQAGNVKLLVQAEGEVTIKAQDALELSVAKDVIEAIGRGFNPSVAMKLFKEDYGLDILSVADFGAKTRSRRIEIKGLVIGNEGKTKRVLERITGANICVYGKTIAIIAPTDCIQTARQAVEMFLTGSKHASVYRFLERKTGEKVEDGEQ